MSTKDWIILYHTLLIGASPLIPLPFVDEWIAQYLRRQLISGIAKSHNATLTRTEIRQLAAEQSGCLGVLSAIFILPLKEIFRDIFFWLEWKRGIDLATQAYYFGYLLGIVFESKEFDSRKAPLYRIAVADVLKGANTKFVRGSIKRTFDSSRSSLRDVTVWLFHFARYYLRLVVSGVGQRIKTFFSRFRRRKSAGSSAREGQEGKLDNYFEESQPQLKDLTSKLVENLRNGIGSIPQEHFDELSKKLLAGVERINQTEYAPPSRSQYSQTGIAAFILSLIGFATMLIMAGAALINTYSASQDILAGAGIWLACIVGILLSFGGGAGLVSLSDSESNNIFGVLSLLIAGVTIGACCLIYGLIILGNGGG
ncbi:MAG: hypothetical protein AB1649_11345 [Chloroflexota bacterium]